ncbi:Uncharacterised protein [Acinetobacter baumannii]|nr:Uncharacterised protein [Acinetobacter baumannii]
MNSAASGLPKRRRFRLRSFCQLQVPNSISTRKITGTQINISCQSRDSSL